MATKSTPGAAPPGFTPENFEKELKALAEKAREQTVFKAVKEQVIVLLRAAALLGLAAVYSNVSQLTLAPVYGAIPSSIWHSQIVTAGCFIGWSANLWLKRNLPRNPLTLLGPLAIYIPMVQFFLLKASSFFGPVCGPVMTEVLTFLPLLVLSVSCAASVLDDLEIGSSRIPRFIADAGPGIGSFTYYKALEFYSGNLIGQTIGTTFVQTRLGLQLLLGALYAVLSPSRLLRYCIPALLHTTILNTHLQTPYTTKSLNSTLVKEGWTLLDRQDSLTGYISVLESQNDGFRVMRCDHSLLGGEWVRLPGGIIPKRDDIKEPIYAVFAMLEAVRLADVAVPVPDSDANALVIGLGIGTTPAALMAHGIDTTIVEIDPVVYDYALKYFSLPSGHTPVIADAVAHAAQLAASEDHRYDYIVHDVFTGGAEPVNLFTEEFLHDLYTVLKPNGVIAINYAGDLLLPSARLIVRTIKSVFPTCRIFREMEAPSSSQLETDGQDFTNMVIFCTKSVPAGSMTFRKPRKADFLKSSARERFLEPRHEISAEHFWEREDDGDVLRRNDTERLNKWQRKSAVGHWRVMRTVLPDAIWQAW